MTKQINKADKLKELTDEIIDIYKAKNKDYGDSFSDSFKEFGITSAVVRMNDKMNRIKSLAKSDDRQVKDESLRDTLIDLANYALMTVLELDCDTDKPSETKKKNETKEFIDNSIKGQYLDEAQIIAAEVTKKLEALSRLER